MWNRMVQQPASSSLTTSLAVQVWNEAGTHIALVLGRPQSRTAVCVIMPEVPFTDSNERPSCARQVLLLGTAGLKPGDVPLFWAPAAPRLACLSAMTPGQSIRRSPLQTVGCEVVHLPWPGVAWAYWLPDAQACPCGCHAVMLSQRPGQGQPDAVRLSG